MNKIIDFLRLLKMNYSTDIIYFERLIEKETGKFIEISIEEDKIKIFHKVTGSNKGTYYPSENFIELATAFIEFNKPSLKLFEMQKIMSVFEKFDVKKSL